MVYIMCGIFAIYSVNGKITVNMLIDIQKQLIQAEVLQEVNSHIVKIKKQQKNYKQDGKYLN